MSDCKHIEWDERWVEEFDSSSDALVKVNELLSKGWEVPDEYPLRVGEDAALERWEVRATRDQCNCRRRRKSAD